MKFLASIRRKLLNLKIFLFLILCIGYLTIFDNDFFNDKNESLNDQILRQKINDLKGNPISTSKFKSKFVYKDYKTISSL